jgi:hypothetical protein
MCHIFVFMLECSETVHAISCVMNVFDCGTRRKMADSEKESRAAWLSYFLNL